MRVSNWVVVGAVLPVALGASFGSRTTSEGAHTWAHPVEPTAFLLLSLGLALSHLLVALGYVELARRTAGRAATLARVGAVGTVVVAGCEVLSGLAARVDLDSPRLTALEAGYAVSALAIIVGTLGAGLVLRAGGSPYALPLVVNGAVLVVATVLQFTVGGGTGVAALTAWGLTYVWLALRLRTGEVREPVLTNQA